jgi:hypothetical protein
MKTKIKLPIVITVFLLALSMSSCTKKQGCMQVSATNFDPNAEEDDGSCTFNGKAIFWTHEDDGLPIIGVVITDNGTSGNITVDNAAEPDCDASGCFTFTAAPGTYSYTASDGGGLTWNGSITITSNGCTHKRLTL